MGSTVQPGQLNRRLDEIRAKPDTAPVEPETLALMRAFGYPKLAADHLVTDQKKLNEFLNSLGEPRGSEFRQALSTLLGGDTSVRRKLPDLPEHPPMGKGRSELKEGSTWEFSKPTNFVLPDGTEIVPPDRTEIGPKPKFTKDGHVVQPNGNEIRIDDPAR